MNDENKSFLKLRERRQSLGALYRSLSKADERPTQLQQRFSVIINPFDLAGLHAADKKLAAKKYANIIGPPLLDDYQDRLEELFEFKAEPTPAMKSNWLETVASEELEGTKVNGEEEESLAEFGNDQSKADSFSQTLSSSLSSSSESKSHGSNSKSGSGSEEAKVDAPNAQKRKHKHK